LASIAKVLCHVWMFSFSGIGSLIEILLSQKSPLPSLFFLSSQE
jgi:hypothetical protein